MPNGEFSFATAAVEAAEAPTDVFEQPPQQDIFAAPPGAQTQFQNFLTANVPTEQEIPSFQDTFNFFRNTPLAQSMSFEDFLDTPELQAFVSGVGATGVVPADPLQPFQDVFNNLSTQFPTIAQSGGTFESFYNDYLQSGASKTQTFSQFLNNIGTTGEIPEAAVPKVLGKILPVGPTEQGVTEPTQEVTEEGELSPEDRAIALGNFKQQNFEEAQAAEANEVPDTGETGETATTIKTTTGTTSGGGVFGKAMTDADAASANDNIADDESDLDNRTLSEIGKDLSIGLLDVAEDKLDRLKQGDYEGAWLLVAQQQRDNAALNMEGRRRQLLEFLSENGITDVDLVQRALGEMEGKIFTDLSNLDRSLAIQKQEYIQGLEDRDIATIQSILSGTTEAGLAIAKTDVTTTLLPFQVNQLIANTDLTIEQINEVGAKAARIWAMTPVEIEVLAGTLKLTEAQVIKIGAEVQTMELLLPLQQKKLSADIDSIIAGIALTDQKANLLATQAWQITEMTPVEKEDLAARTGLTIAQIDEVGAKADNIRENTKFITQNISNLIADEELTRASITKVLAQADLTDTQKRKLENDILIDNADFQLRQQGLSIRAVESMIGLVGAENFPPEIIGDMTSYIIDIMNDSDNIGKPISEWEFPEFKLSAQTEFSIDTETALANQEHDGKIIYDNEANAYSLNWNGTENILKDDNGNIVDPNMIDFDPRIEGMTYQNLDGSFVVMVNNDAVPLSQDFINPNDDTQRWNETENRWNTFTTGSVVGNDELTGTGWVLRKEGQESLDGSQIWQSGTKAGVKRVPTEIPGIQEVFIVRNEVFEQVAKKTGADRFQDLGNNKFRVEGGEFNGAILELSTNFTGATVLAVFKEEVISATNGQWIEKPVVDPILTFFDFEADPFGSSTNEAVLAGDRDAIRAQAEALTDDPINPRWSDLKMGDSVWSFMIDSGLVSFAGLNSKGTERELFGRPPLNQWTYFDGFTNEAGIPIVFKMTADVVSDLRGNFITVKLWDGTDAFIQSQDGIHLVTEKFGIAASSSIDLSTLAGYETFKAPESGAVTGAAAAAGF